MSKKFVAYPGDKLVIDSGVRIIDVLILIEYENQDLAAARLIEHPKNIAKHRRINELKLQILNDIAASALSSIQSCGFEITQNRQYKKDYSYYIQFNATDKEGNLLVPVGIRFRISNHKMKGNETELNSETVVIRSFVVRGKHYENSVSIIQTISMICRELRNGNLDVLDNYTY